MTEAIAPCTNIYLQETLPIIHYQVAMPQPETHLFEVTLRLMGYRSPILDLKLPVWTPGSYLVREYAKHLQDFVAFAKDKSERRPPTLGNSADKPLSWRKISKNHWQVETSNVSEITVRYRIFANELSVRTNHLDATHGYFNGAALFFRLPGWEGQPIWVTIVPPRPEWQVTTALPPVPEQANTEGHFHVSRLNSGNQSKVLAPQREKSRVSRFSTPVGEPDVVPNRPSDFSAPGSFFFYASDFDTLVDSPFEIGYHQLYHFEVLEKPHELAIWGQGNFQAPQLIADIKKIIEVEAQMFGGLPYQRYVFLLHLFTQAYGGLEHKNCCSLIYQRFGFRDRDKYDRFMQLVAHEFFHLWNVKRIRPKALEVFDYDQENYTPSLWFCEGTTSYYDLLIPLRAGIYDVKSFLNNCTKDITRLVTTYGRKVQPLSESSFDAWIKLYRQDANSGNSQMSYYLKGEIVSLLLDLLIRSRHGNQHSLDDVMLKMWQQFGRDEIGYTPEQLQEIIESVAGIDLTDFFKRYIDGTEDLPFNEYLEPFGLQLIADTEEEPYLGVKVNTENGRELIKFVEAGSPAQLAGIDPGDELLAINRLRVAANGLSDRLKDYQSSDIIQVTVFHQDEIRTYSVTLASPRPSRYQIKPVENPSSIQQENFAGWLGASLNNYA